MKKQGKILLIVLGVLAAALIVLLVIANRNKKETVEILIPDGSLSSDFFVSQNTIYQKNDALPVAVPLLFAPYSVDTPNVVHGDVGEGEVYNVDELYNLYISEADEEEDVVEHILSEYPQTLLLTADPKKCSFEKIKESSGYINGFEAEYYVAGMNISDGKESGEEFFVGYVLHVPEYHENLIVALTTKVLSTESLSNAEAYAVSVIHTLQYVEKFNESITLRREPVIEEPSEEIVKTEEISEEPKEEEIPKVPTNAIVQIEEITIDKDYANLTIEYSWENADTMIEAKLYSGGTKFSPSKYERGKAIFELGMFKAGSYQMEVKGYDYGETKVEFIGQ